MIYTVNNLFLGYAVPYFGLLCILLPQGLVMPTWGVPRVFWSWLRFFCAAHFPLKFLCASTVLASQDQLSPLIYCQQSQLISNTRSTVAMQGCYNVGCVQIPHDSWGYLRNRYFCKKPPLTGALFAYLTCFLQANKRKCGTGTHNNTWIH